MAGEKSHAAHHTRRSDRPQRIHCRFIFALMSIERGKLKIDPVRQVFIVPGLPLQQFERSDLAVFLSGLLVGSEGGFKQLAAAIVEC